MPPTGRRPTDEELLDGARAVFAERGYRAAGMAEVARRASTTKPTLYAHFGSKESLYLQLFDREADALRNHLFAVYDTMPIDDVGIMTRTALNAGMAYVATHPDGFRVLMATGEPGNPASASFRRLIETFVDRVALIVDADVARRGLSTQPASIRTVAAMMVASGLEAARQGILVDGLSAQHAADIAAVYMAGGLSSIDELR
ncbi:MAG: helix-turn-helix domain-containing protein [Rhodococcus sp. (in: high G+C Gram-positive bacteria)]